MRRQLRFLRDENERGSRRIPSRTLPGCTLGCKHKLRGQTMPIINVKLVEGVLQTDQKRQLLSRLTDAVESVYPGLRDVTFVTIEEVKDGDWGIGGQSINARKVAAHAEKNLTKA
jgi:4-oxalocrotonate tautomerase